MTPPEPIPDVTTLDVTTLDACPACGSSWIGDPIPETRRHYYGSATHFRRLIAIYDSEQDRTVRWRCPDCKEEWER